MGLSPIVIHTTSRIYQFHRTGGDGQRGDESDDRRILDGVNVCLVQQVEEHTLMVRIARDCGENNERVAMYNP
jgi:hypothetical protein